MMTTEGKTHVKRYLAGFNSAIAQSIAFGIGATAESASDANLALEVTRAPINLTSYDFINNRIIYKATIPEEFVGTIYEAGVYSLLSDPSAGGFDSHVVTSFDSETEIWLNGSSPSVFSTTVNRLGIDSLSQTPSTSTSQTDSLANIFLDFSGYSSADTFQFAYNVSLANTSGLRYRFLTDSSNYYDFNLGAQTTGYKVIELTKGSATPTGTPTWSNITQIQVTTTAGGGGGTSIQHDAIRVQDKDSINLDYVLVSRKVLASPVVKILGQSQDIEYTIDVTI